MIIDCRDLQPGPVRVRGTLVIGSGPVGLILALYLMQHGGEVVVVEGGGPSAGGGDMSDLETEISGSFLEGATIGRSRQIGGGLNLWGGQLACLMADEIAPILGRDRCWPIPLSEVTGRLPLVTQLLGQPAITLPLRHAALEAESASLLACDLTLVTTAWLKRPKLAQKIWRELAASAAVKIVHGAFVDRLAMDPVIGASRGASALRRDGNRIEFEARRVVLACGAIETSRLLLQPSGSGSDQPWRRLFWLGRGFNEHLDANTAVVRPLDKGRLLDVFDPIVVNGTKYTPKVYARTATGCATQLSSFAMLSFPGNLRNSLSELGILLRGLTPKGLPGNVGDLYRAALASAREIAPLTTRYISRGRIGSALRDECYLRVSVEQTSSVENRIDLSPTKKDSRGVALARIHWRKGEDEGRTFLEMTRRVKFWAERNRIAVVNVNRTLIEDPVSFAQHADEGLHHAGGARMAISPNLGVVDRNLQVFGVEGLYCCGTSVFPCSGIANPTMTAMAMAVRLGEHILADRRS